MAKNDPLELVDAAPPPALTLNGTLPNGTIVEVHFEPPDPTFFKTIKPGDTLPLQVREVREHVTRQRRAKR